MKIRVNNKTYEISKLTATTNMGNCQCGNTMATFHEENGVLVVKTNGSEKWQCYEGTAMECTVEYGMGKLARAMSAELADVGIISTTNGGQGTYLDLSFSDENE